MSQVSKKLVIPSKRLSRRPTLLNEASFKRLPNIQLLQPETLPYCQGLLEELLKGKADHKWSMFFQAMTLLIIKGRKVKMLVALSAGVIEIII